MLSFRKSLVFRIFVISLILLALPLLVDSFMIMRSRYMVKGEEARKFLIYSPQTRVYVLSNILQVREQTITLSEEILGLPKNLKASEKPFLNRKLKELSQAAGFEKSLILKKNGKYSVLAATFNEGTDTPFDSYAFFEEIGSREYPTDHFSFLYTFPDQSHHVLVGKVIRDEKGDEVGLFMYMEDITERLQSMLTATHGLFELNYAVLMKNSLVVASGSEDFKNIYFYNLSPFELNTLQSQFPFKGHLQKISTTSVGGNLFKFQSNGEEFVGTISEIPGTDYMLLVSAPSFLMEHSYDFFYKNYLYFGLILILGGLLALYASKRIARPFQQLSDVMVGIQKGDLTKRYRKDPFGFEINALGAGFNEMIKNLLEKRKVAEEEKVKVEIYDKELRLGQQIQRGLLPSKMLHFKGNELAEKYLPAKEVGGDFFDLFVREIDGKEQLVLVIADASGKGVHACFYSLGVRSDLRVFARSEKDPADVMRHVNRLFYTDSSDTGMFVTVLVGIFDPETRELSYCSSGHNPPLVRRENGEVEILENVGMAVGVMKDAPYSSKKTVLNKGDVLFFYTDGVTEAHNEKNELFGEERLMTFLRSKEKESAETIAQELIDEIRVFQGSSQHDDITLLLMKLS